MTRVELWPFTEDEVLIIDSEDLQTLQNGKKAPPPTLVELTEQVGTFEWYILQRNAHYKPSKTCFHLTNTIHNLKMYVTKFPIKIHEL